MSELKIEVESREATGKNASRRVRAAGNIPAVVYGGGKNSVAIQVEEDTIRRLLRSEGGENSVFLLELAGTGKSRHAMIRDLTIDPISRDIWHIDFQRVNMKQKVRVQVPIELLGLAEGVKTEGGVLDFIRREVEVECLPGNIPPRFELDVTALGIGDHLEAKDISIADNVTLLDPLDSVLVSIAHSRVAAEIEEAEAEAGVEGEVLLEAESDEPAVIGKGKEDEAEED